MERVLITGGAGFIGCNLVRRTLATSPQARVWNLDALTYAGASANLDGLPDPDRHVFVKGNICDEQLVEGLLEREQIDTILHLAAESHVDRSIKEPRRFVETNVLGTLTLLQAARRAWLERKLTGGRPARFHHVSTDEVFGSLAADDPACTEESPYAPSSPYAASKAASDHLVRAFGHTYGLPITISNCSNNYGPYQFPEKLVPLLILNALEGKPLPVYGDGLQVRDWLHVEDHCDAILLIAQRGRPGETYCVGGGNQPANLQVAEAVCRLLDELRPDSPHRPHKQLIQHVRDRPGHDRRYALDSRKAQRELGWRPARGIAEGLRETVAWYLGNPHWVDHVRKQQAYRQWMSSQYEAGAGG